MTKVSNILFFLIALVFLFLCNITLFFKGYSYISYSFGFTMLLGYILFSKKWNRFQCSILSTIFILYFLNTITEIFCKFKPLSFITQTEFDSTTCISLTYLSISIIIGLLWSRKKNQ